MFETQNPSHYSSISWLPQIFTSPNFQSSSLPSVQIYAILLLLCFFLTACGPSQPTAKYYLLSENPARILEVDPALPQDERVTREFDLKGLKLSDDGLEGIAFISGVDLVRYGYDDFLPPPAESGYFLLVTQQNTRLYVVEAPLSWAAGGPAHLIEAFPILNLDSGASDIYYAEGEIWVTFAEEQRLYHLAPVETSGGLVKLSELNFSRMPVPAGDVEGFTLMESNVAFIGDDAAQRVTRLDNFSDCISNNVCAAAWSRDMAPLEPSGLAWDALNDRLVGVDDEGQLFSLSPDGSSFETMLKTDLDLEGVTVVIQ
jgi:hypothetical protein